MSHMSGYYVHMLTLLGQHSNVCVNKTEELLQRRLLHSSNTQHHITTHHNTSHHKRTNPNRHLDYTEWTFLMIIWGFSSHFVLGMTISRLSSEFCASVCMFVCVWCQCLFVFVRVCASLSLSVRVQWILTTLVGC